MIEINEDYMGVLHLNDYWQSGICMHTELRNRREIAEQITAFLMGWV